MPALKNVPFLFPISVYPCFSFFLFFFKEGKTEEMFYRPTCYEQTPLRSEENKNGPEGSGFQQMSEELGVPFDSGASHFHLARLSHVSEL